MLQLVYLKTLGWEIDGRIPPSHVGDVQVDGVHRHLLSSAAKEVDAKMSDVVVGTSPTENQPIPR